MAQGAEYKLEESMKMETELIELRAKQSMTQLQVIRNHLLAYCRKTGLGLTTSLIHTSTVPVTVYMYMYVDPSPLLALGYNDVATCTYCHVSANCCTCTYCRVQVANLEQEKIKLTEDLDHAQRRLSEELELQQQQYFQVDSDIEEYSITTARSRIRGGGGGGGGGYG